MSLSSSASSSGEISIYGPVHIIETDASIRTGLNPHDEYRLEVEHSRIILYMSNTILWTWPLKNLRRYGYTSNSFSLEAGSKCSSGAGMFIFKIKNQQSVQIYENVLSNVARIKTQQQRKMLERTLKCRSVPEIDYRTSVPGQQSSSSSSEDSSAPLILPRKHSTVKECILPIPHYRFNNTEYATIVKK